MGLLKELDEAYVIYKERDPAIRTRFDVLLYPCFWAIRAYRKAHKHWEKGHYFRARQISQRAARKTGIEIHPGATIGKGLFIDHGTGVVIGETTVIGDDVTLYQGVTLGGTGKEKGKRHPTIGNGVMVSSGAKLLGSFTVGDNAKIGAGSVVLESVPEDCTVVGIPGRVVRMKNRKVHKEDLDHGDMPDPILEDMKVLQRANTELINRLIQLEGEVRNLKKEQGEAPVEEDKQEIQGAFMEDRPYIEIKNCLFENEVNTIEYFI
ncbi:MAG: serine O-acetyltransferase [Lachnospiraceae bacterium]|nr:serine O-acetyltransferase [Candidatus Equihabitans merdae]